MWFKWFKKNRSTQMNANLNGIVYDQITKINEVCYCYCSSFKAAHDNATKVLNHFSIDNRIVDEIMDGLHFVITEIPTLFPIEKMRIALYNRHTIQIDDTLQKNKLSQTCPYYAVSYMLYIGTDGLKWSVLVCDFMGEWHTYKSSKNYLLGTKDEYSIKNVYDFINSALNAMGYWAISIPKEKQNLIKPKYYTLKQ